MSVSDRAKQQIMLDNLPAIVEALAAKTPGEPVAADDIADVLAMGIAAVLDNDPELNDPLRQVGAIQFVTRRIASQLEALGEFRQQNGQSLMSWLMHGPLKPPGELN